MNAESGLEALGEMTRGRSEAVGLRIAGTGDSLY